MSSPAGKKCAEAKFDRQIDTSGIKKLEKMSRSGRLSLAWEICESGRQLKASEAEPPLRGDVINGAAQKWNLSSAEVEVIADAAKHLCPNEVAVIDALPVTAGDVSVMLIVEGNGSIEVTYSNEKGGKSKERATAPWQKTITLSKPMGVSVDARADSSAKIRCAILVADKTLSEQTFSSVGDSVSCHATKDQIVTAANSNWTGTQGARPADQTGKPGN